MLNLLGYHLLEQVPREHEGDEGPSEYSGHRHWDGKEEASRLAVEHLGVSKSKHDVVQRYRQGHYQCGRVKQIDSSNCEEGVRPDPRDEHVEVTLYQLQIKYADTYDNEERREAENLSNTLACTT